MILIFEARWVPGLGGVAQLGEHLLCKQGVIGSIPIVSTIMVCLWRWSWIVLFGEQVSNLVTGYLVLSVEAALRPVGMYRGCSSSAGSWVWA